MSVSSTGGFLCGSDGKESACSAGDLGSIPESGRSLEKGITIYSSILAGEFHGQRSLAGYIVHSVAESEQLIHTPPLDGDVLKGRNFDLLTFGHSFIQYHVKNTC